jgi:hypothetical protein
MISQALSGDEAFGLQQPFHILGYIFEHDRLSLKEVTIVLLKRRLGTSTTQ